MILFFSHRTDDHPAMKLWARSWMKPKVPEKPKPKPAPLVIPSLESSLSPTLDSSLSEFKDTLSIDGSLDPEASLTPHQTEQIAIIMAMSGDLEMATLANLALPCEVGLDSSASSMIDGSLLKEDQNLGDVEMGGLSSVGQGEVVDVGIGLLASAVGIPEVKNAPEAPTVATPGMDVASSPLNAGNVGEIPLANIPKTPVIQKSRSEDFDPPTVKFVMSSGTERSPAKEPAIVDISDIPSTSAGPSQEQLEAAGMMRFQPLTHSGRREETRRPPSPPPQDESSLDTESSMEVDIEDAKPDQSKEVLISRTAEAETKEDVESMDDLQEPESDPSASIKSKSQTQLDTVPIKEPSITKSPVEGDTSVVADPQVDDGSVVPRAKPEGMSHQSTVSEIAPALVATNKQDDVKQKEEVSPVNVNIASTETDQETEKEDGSAKPDIASLADVKTPEDMAMDIVSDVQSEGSEARVPTDHPNPTPDTMDVQKHIENVTTPDDVPQDTPPAETRTVKDSLKEGQDDTVPADSGLESGIPSSTSSSVTPSAMEGIEPSMAANPAGDDVALVPSNSLDQPHPTPVDPGTVDTPVTVSDPVNKETAMTAVVGPGGLVVPPIVGPAGDGQALVTPDVSVLGPVGMSGDAPPVPMEVEDQPSTSGFTNQPILPGVNLDGSDVWTPVKVGFCSALQSSTNLMNSLG